MKIFISIDAEGCSGITRFEQVDRNNVEFPDTIAAMQRDLQCVIEGAAQGGATEFVVCDAHGNGNNLPCLPSGKGISVVRGHSAPLSMMQGLDNSFAGAFFIGYHAKRGTSSVMSHTYFPNCTYDVKLAGVSVGEFGLNAALAQYYAVIPLLVSGDECMCKEATSFCSNITTVAVKNSYSSNCAICYTDACAKLKEGAKTAMLKANSNAKISHTDTTIEVTYFTSEMADAVSLMPNCTKVSGDTIKFDYGDYLVNFKAMLLGFYVASKYILPQ